MITGVVASQRSEPESRTSPLVGIAFVVSVLMMLIYSEAWIAPLFGDAIDPQLSYAVRSGFIPAYAMGLFILILRPGAVLKGLVGQPFLILILLIAAASISWSVSPDQTVRRVIALTMTTISGVALGARWRWPALVELLAVTFAIVVLGSLLAGLLFPSFGRMTEIYPGAWRGLYVEKNSFGGRMALGVFVFVAAALLKPERAWLWLSMAALSFVMILLSTSKTALLSGVVGLSALGLTLLIRQGRALAVLGVYVSVVGFTALCVALVLAPSFFLAFVGKDATLNGRTQIWAAVMRQIQKNPWTGYGYGATWSEDSVWGPRAWINAQAGFTAVSAHNSWLEQMLGMGYWGLGAWTLYFATTIVRAIGAIFTSEGSLLAAPLLTSYTLTTLTESVAVGYNDLFWVMLVAISIRLALPDALSERQLAGR